MGSSIYSSERAGPKKESVALRQGRRDTGLGQGWGWLGSSVLGGVTAHMTSPSSFLPYEELAGLQGPGKGGREPKAARPPVYPHPRRVSGEALK